MKDKVEYLQNEILQKEESLQHMRSVFSKQVHQYKQLLLQQKQLAEELHADQITRLKGALVASIQHHMDSKHAEDLLFIGLSLIIISFIPHSLHC